MYRHRLWFSIFTIIFTVIISISIAEASYGFRWGRIGVMTQNVFVGADLGDLADATSKEQIPIVAAALLRDIQDADFLNRAKAFAEKVARERPHLIGLQEVVLIRTQCPGDASVGGIPATNVYTDYLEILMQALADEGLEYDVAAEVENADVEVPAAAFDAQGPLLPDCTTGFPYLVDLRVTDRDVILARGDVATDNAVENNFSTNLVIPTVAGPVEFTRGYVAVDAYWHGRHYFFANTHIEVRGGSNPIFGSVRLAQTTELVDELDSVDGTLIIVGDFNSAEEDGPGAKCTAGPVGPIFDCPTPYELMVEANYIDIWKKRRGKRRAGDTCCQDKDLLNAESALDRRIDLVWVRTPKSHHWGSGILGVGAKTIGDRQEDRTADGLWYSDHAGVSARMILRAPYSRRHRYWW